MAKYSYGAGAEEDEGCPSSAVYQVALTASDHSKEWGTGAHKHIHFTLVHFVRQPSKGNVIFKQSAARNNWADLFPFQALVTSCYQGFSVLKQKYKEWVKIRENIWEITFSRSTNSKCSFAQPEWSLFCCFSPSSCCLFQCCKAREVRESQVYYL